MSIVNGKFALKAAFRSTTFLLTPSSFPTPSTYSIARPASFHTHLGRFPTPLAHPLARQAHFPSLGSLTFLMRTSNNKIASVVHEPSGLEPDSSRAGSSPSSPALGGSNRGRRADSSPLATRAGSGRGPQADSTLDSSLLAVSWQFLRGSSRLESARV